MQPTTIGARKIPPHTGSRWVFSNRSRSKKRLAFRSKESVCVDVREVWRRERTLRPDDRSGPGLAPVRGRDWPAPEKRGFEHVHQTQRHATCAAVRRFAAR